MKIRSITRIPFEHQGAVDERVVLLAQEFSTHDYHLFTDRMTRLLTLEGLAGQEIAPQCGLTLDRGMGMRGGQIVLGESIVASGSHNLLAWYFQGMFEGPYAAVPENGFTKEVTAEPPRFYVAAQLQNVGDDRYRWPSMITEVFPGQKGHFDVGVLDFVEKGLPDSQRLQHYRGSFMAAIMGGRFARKLLDDLGAAVPEAVRRSYLEEKLVQA